MFDGFALERIAEAAQVQVPVDAAELLGSLGMPAAHQCSAMSALRQRLTLLAWSRQIEIMLWTEFCKRLLHDGGPVYLVVDGHPAHRAKKTTNFVASTDGRLKLFFLPGYSPELNPTSGSGAMSNTTASAKRLSPGVVSISVKRASQSSLR